MLEALNMLLGSKLVAAVDELGGSPFPSRAFSAGWRQTAELGSGRSEQILLFNYKHNINGSS